MSNPSPLQLLLLHHPLILLLLLAFLLIMIIPLFAPLPFLIAANNNYIGHGRNA